MNTKIAILGSGTWGSAVGELLSHNGLEITMWQRSQEKAIVMEKTRTHPHLSHFTFSDGISFSTNLELSLTDASFIFLAVPSHCIRNIVLKSLPFISDESILINLSKGLELDSLLTMSQVIEEVTHKNIISLYGPSHAEEVIENIPTTLVAASKDLAEAKKVQSLVSSEFMRVYTNNDIIGVELGGSVKNIIAIAAGICDGIGFGDNTKAAILTRGLAEMTRLGESMGAKKSTFSGLSGMGDLIVTCLSSLSRNRYLGEEIGKGKSLNEILDEMDMVAEGVKTAKAIHALREKHNVEMPISEAVYNILFKNHNPLETVTKLMTRNLISEI